MNFLDKFYKHIFVDFDSTLYLWDNNPERTSLGDIAFEAMRLLKKERTYDSTYINELLVDYLKLQKQSGAEIHLTTQCDFSFGAEAKFKFMENNYPGLLTDYISTASNESKIRLMETYEYAGNPKNTMLMIDDRFEVVHGCRHAGFNVQEPQFIMGMMAKAKGNISVWNTPDVRPDIDNSMATAIGYTSSDLIIIYKENGEEHLGFGWYSEDGNWYLQGKEEPSPAKIILWTEYPHDV